MKTDYRKLSLEMHRELRGKIEIKSRAKASNKEELSLAYTPGVAEPCLAIQENKDLSFELTRRWNTVAVITDGTAVLGLGDIGPEAGMPVMEGKCVLFKEFAGVDAIPLCIRSKDVDEIVNAITLFAGSFGGINLEDIAAPRCFEIERRLKETCDIPIYHDDQHGTSVVTLAGIINALKLVKKSHKDVKVVFSGAGAAGAAIANLFLHYGFENIIMTNIDGIVHRDIDYGSEMLDQLKMVTNKDNIKGGLKEALVGADVLIGVSAANLVTKEMVETMADDSIIFAMANPAPEIMPDEAKAGGARIIATGRSDFPNQINNVLAFPGVFRGALDARAKDITEDMNMAAAKAIADLISDEELSDEYIIPSPFNKKVAEAVAKAVYDVAKK